MTLATSIALAALCVSVITGLFAILTYHRAGRWKEGEDAKLLVAEVASIDKRLTTVEAEIKGLATKADLAEVRADLRGLERSIEKTAAGVERIEQFMMEKSR